MIRNNKAALVKLLSAQGPIQVHQLQALLDLLQYSKKLN